MYTYKKKIIICKFNLKNKCKFGDKCKFLHLNVNELNNIICELEVLKLENQSLRSNLKVKCQEIENLNKKYCDVTNDSVHALLKPAYNAFFKINDQKELNKNDLCNQKNSKEHVKYENIDKDDQVWFNNKKCTENNFKPSNIQKSKVKIHQKQINFENKISNDPIHQIKLNNDGFEEMLKKSSIFKELTSIVESVDITLKEQNNKLTKFKKRLRYIEKEIAHGLHFLVENHPNKADYEPTSELELDSEID